MNYIHRNTKLYMLKQQTNNQVIIFSFSKFFNNKVLGDKTLCLLQVPAYLLILYSTLSVYCNMYFSVVNFM